MGDKLHDFMLALGARENDLGPSTLSKRWADVQDTESPFVSNQKPYPAFSETPEGMWAAFEKEQPLRATAKKFIRTSVGGATDALTKPVEVPDAEKLAATKMLREYIMAQDRIRAEEEKKRALWDAAWRERLDAYNNRPRPPSPPPLPYPNQRPLSLEVGPAQVSQAPLSLEVGEAQFPRGAGSALTKDVNRAYLADMLKAIGPR